MPERRDDDHRVSTESSRGAPGSVGELARTMASENASYLTLFHRGTNIDRTVFFSDAVFAIAMTLLVLDIKVPEISGPNAVAPDQLGAFLLGDGFHYFAYALSFVVIATRWIAHHAMFTVITAYDRRLQMLNLAVMFFVTALPVPTSILAEYGSSTWIAPALYAAVISLISILQLFVWFYARKHGFIAAAVTPALFRHYSVNAAIVPIYFLLTIPLSLVNPSWALYSWLGLFVVPPCVSWMNTRHSAKESLRRQADGQ